MPDIAGCTNVFGLTKLIHHDINNALVYPFSTLEIPATGKQINCLGVEAETYRKYTKQNEHLCKSLKTFVLFECLQK